jgi:hypothetical protein
MAKQTYVEDIRLTHLIYLSSILFYAEKIHLCTRYPYLIIEIT